MDQQTIHTLSSTGRHQECLQTCQQLLQSEPENPLPWKYAGKSLLALGQFDKAKQCLIKAHQLDNKDPEIIKDIGNIFNALQNDEEAIRLYKSALSMDQNYAPAINNLGLIAKRHGKLSAAEHLIKKAIDLDPSFAPYHNNLGGIYKDLGKLDQALASTLKSLELDPENPEIYINLGSIYRDLGDIDQALASTLKSLELKPEGSLALCKLGLIKMAQGHTKEAKRDLLISIKYNDQECEAFHALSAMIDTKEEAEEIIDLMGSVKRSTLTPQTRALAEFALSNCFHKINKYEIASEHLQSANKYKLIARPSNADALLQKIELSTSCLEAAQTTNVNTNIGEGRIFIVGMPRSGSTLLETILSMNPKIKDLGESLSLERAIGKIQQLKYSFGCPTIGKIYSQMEPINRENHKYTTDKNLYNFMRIDWIAAYMPSAKIIHCRRNPMDNILSMHRSNLTAGNNYTANLEDAAKVLAAQEQAMQIQKMRYPEKIYTFDYDQFVNAPEINLRKLLGWLDLDFNESYLHPETSTRNINTASVMQARKPISNKSVGGSRHYEDLLRPALKVFQESGIEIK